MRITKRHFQNDPPLPEELSNAISDIRDDLKDIELKIPEIRDRTNWIGVAATVTTAAAIELGMAKFDAEKIHEMILTREMVEEIFRTLATEPFSDRLYPNPFHESFYLDLFACP